MAVIAEPNKSVKGSRRQLAVLTFCFYQGLAASLKFSERRALLTVTLNDSFPYCSRHLAEILECL